MTDYNAENNFIVWADLPVADLDRAINFYAKVTQKTIEKMQYGDMEFALVEHDKGNGACLIIQPDIITDKGPLLYINVDGYIDEAVKTAEALGSKVIEPVTIMGDYGSRAVIIDSEGNRIALHSK